MKYLYGPVHSRRLGSSLGISLVPHKTCNFDCVYCQLGKTNRKTSARKAYVRADSVMQELRRWISANPGQAAALDFITFSGAGEPTLHTGIGGLIRQIKKETGIPVCVITNSSFLTNKRVRKALLDADLVVPSLDAVDQMTFKRVDRPSGNIRVSSIIRGLARFRKEYRGKLWLEVMIVKGYNDSIVHAKKLKTVIAMIKPQLIQINSPVRHTAESGIFPADPQRLDQIKIILGRKATVV